MKPNETTNELLTRITRTTRVIRESFDEYDAKIPYPHNNANGGISNNSFQRFLRQYKLRSVVAQQEQETITIKRMYQVATTAQRELKGKGPALVNEVREEEIPAENETDDVAAFNRRGARPRNNQSGGQSRGNYNSGKEDINQDQAEEPATLEAETTATGMASTATSAKFRGTAKRNAAKG